MQSVVTINSNSSSKLDAVAYFFQTRDFMYYLHNFLDIESKVRLSIASSQFRRAWILIIDSSNVDAKFELMIRLWCANYWQLAHRLILGDDLLNVELNASILQPDKLRVFVLSSKIFFRPTSYLETLRQLKGYCDACGINKKEDITVMESSVQNLITICRQRIRHTMQEFLTTNHYAYISDYFEEFTWTAKAIKIISSIDETTLFILRYDFLLATNALSSYFYLNGRGYDSGSAIISLPLRDIPVTRKRTIQQWYAMATNHFLEYPQRFLRLLIRSEDSSNATTILVHLLYRTSLRNYYSLQEFFNGKLPCKFEIARQAFEWIVDDMNMTKGNIILYVKIFTGWLLRQCLPPFGFKPQAVDDSVSHLTTLVLRYNSTETRVGLLHLVLPVISLYDITHNYVYQEAYDLVITFLAFVFDSSNSIDRKLIQVTVGIYKVVEFIKMAEKQNKSRDVITEIAIKIILNHPALNSDMFLNFDLLWNLSTNRERFASTIPYYMFHETFYFKKAVGFFRNLPGWVDAWLYNHARYDWDIYKIEPNFVNRLSYSQWCERERELYLSSKKGVKRTLTMMNT